MKHALSMDNSSSLPPAKKAMKWVDDSSDDGASEVSNESHGLSSGDDVSLFQGSLLVKIRVPYFCSKFNLSSIGLCFIFFGHKRTRKLISGHF